MGRIQETLNKYKIHEAKPFKIDRVIKNVADNKADKIVDAETDGSVVDSSLSNDFISYFGSDGSMIARYNFKKRQIEIGEV